MEKHKIIVRVGGKNYTLISSDPPEYVRRVAALVDRRLNEMQIASGMALQQASVLTCFNLADELLKARDENTELKRRMQRLAAGKETDAPGETESKPSWQQTEIR
jgi:cell division protein ZapA